MSTVASTFVAIRGIYNNALRALDGKRGPEPSVCSACRLWTVIIIAFAVVHAARNDLSQPIQ